MRATKMTISTVQGQPPGYLKPIPMKKANPYSALRFGQTQGDQVQFSGKKDTVVREKAWPEAVRRFKNAANSSCFARVIWIAAPIAIPLMAIAIWIKNLSTGQFSQQEPPVEIGTMKDDLEAKKGFVSAHEKRKPEYLQLDISLRGKNASVIKIHSSEPELVNNYLYKFDDENKDYKVYKLDLNLNNFSAKRNNYPRLGQEATNRIQAGLAQLNLSKDQKAIIAFDGINQLVLESMTNNGYFTQLKERFPNVKLVFSLPKKDSTMNSILDMVKSLQNMAAPEANAHSDNVQTIELNNLDAKEISYLAQKDNTLKKEMSDKLKISMSDGVLADFITKVKTQYPLEFSSNDLALELDRLSTWADTKYPDKAGIKALGSSDIETFAKDMLIEGASINAISAADRSKEGLFNRLEHIYTSDDMSMTKKQYNIIKQQISDLPDMTGGIGDIANKSDFESRSRRLVKLLYKMPWKVNPIKEGLTVESVKAELQKKLIGMDYLIEDVAEQIIEQVSSAKKDNKPVIICLDGVAGTGKTTLAKAIAEILGLDFAQAQMSGIEKKSELSGHQSLYVGSDPGSIVRGLISTQMMEKEGSLNPVFLLDEIDKTSDNPGTAQSLENALIPIIDPDQNKEFNDKYFNEIPIDLSKIVFIATSNNFYKVNGPLQSRMQRLEVRGYSPITKQTIAREISIPQLQNEKGFEKNEINVAISNETLEQIIYNYSLDGGVRTLNNALKVIANKFSSAKRQGKSLPDITSSNLVEFLGPKPKQFYFDKVEDPSKERIGELNVMVARHASNVIPGGFTEEGVIVTDIHETKKTPQASGLYLDTTTGLHGDSSKEAFENAKLFVRKFGHLFKGQNQGSGSLKEFFKENRVVINFANPIMGKTDGPSGGTAAALNLISALTLKGIPQGFALTGRLNPNNGEMQWISGVREKIMYSVIAGVDKIAISTQNQEDLDRFRETDPEFFEQCIDGKVEIKAFNNIFDLMKSKLLWNEIPKFDAEKLKTYEPEIPAFNKAA